MSKSFVNTLFIMFTLISCNSNQNMKVDQESAVWTKYIFDNKEVVKEFNKLYPYNEQGRLFKIIISRRDHFVRVNIYQIRNKQSILNDLPNSIEKNSQDIFLFYNGMEVINNQISKDNLIKSLDKLTSINDGNFSNPKILQFDIDLKKHIQFNYPPINPYDIEVLNSKESKFPKIK